MRSVCIGIHVHAEPDRLGETLASVRANSGFEFDLLLLPDGPDASTGHFLSTLTGTKQSGTADAKGAPACFNRLAAASEADVLVLLESGSIVGPGWLELLVSALGADPGNGLAGPSTNSSWNEQGVFPRSGGTEAEITATARGALTRFGTQTRTLEPLYSLADFCYAVRREVIEAVGAADESYGLGPCWEMDYNIRAMRAGYRGLWVCGAYVYRSPFTVRRRLEEQRRFAANKRRYQDKFCGAHLRAEKTDYRPHCRGDVCPNFAPAELTQINHAFPKQHCDDKKNCGTDERVPSVNLLSSSAAFPLVTCIMPTSGRRRFAAQAIRYFQRQDYPNLELLVLDDGAEPVSEYIPRDSRIRYMYLPGIVPLGHKRNLACENANGEIVVHWDDDDWYSVSRVSRQVQALLESGADLCGTSRVSYYQPSTGQAWEYAYSGSSSLKPWVGGNTLAFRKSLWEKNRFPGIKVGEDSRFIWDGPAKKIVDLADPFLCVGIIHALNTSPKQTRGAFWRSQSDSAVRGVLGDDFYFYRAMNVQDLPLVSCIMPTFNRRRFLPLAIESFLSQDYPNKELIVVDDGDDKVGDLTFRMPGVHYVGLSKRLSIGAKRNIACRNSKGGIIAHWDDDDWYAPDRLTYQVMPLISGDADLTGLENSFVLELAGPQFWTTTRELHQRMFVGDVHGGTLVYRKDLLAAGLKYPEVNLAEDAWLLRHAADRGKRLMQLSNPGVFVYVRHGGNAWRECAPGRFLDPAGWRRISAPSTFPDAMLAKYLETLI